MWGTIQKTCAEKGGRVGLQSKNQAGLSKTDERQSQMLLIAASFSGCLWGKLASFGKFYI